MSLFTDLKDAARSLDQQFQVSSNEVPAVLSALIHHIEHPDDFLKAAEDGGVAAVTELLSPAPPEGQPSDPAAPAGASEDELRRQVADLEAQLAAREATSQQTTVTHETGSGGDVSPPAGGAAD